MNEENDMTHPIQDVLTAEKEAEKIIEKAAAKRQAILTKAKQEALLLVTEEQKKIDDEMQRCIENARQEIEKRVAKISSEATEEVRKLERLAAKKLDKASNFILAELETRIG